MFTDFRGFSTMVLKPELEELGFSKFKKLMSLLLKCSSYPQKPLTADLKANNTRKKSNSSGLVSWQT
jgi:hypothetical protein